jgi:hypothetical protein
VALDPPPTAKSHLWPNTVPALQSEPHMFQWRFRPWKGEPIQNTYGGKAILDSEGRAVFAELAIIDVLKQHGFDGAAWVDSYRKCFRNAMPPQKCELPDHVLRVYSRIAEANGKKAGCWDVIAWNSENVSFVECKRKGKDRMTANEWKWLDSALKVGIALKNFAICEWEFDGASG